MPQYSVAIEVLATMYMEIEADSKEEAKEKARQEAYPPMLCHRCSDEVEIDELGKILEVNEITRER